MGFDVFLVHVRGLHYVQVQKLVEVGRVEVSFQVPHGLVEFLLGKGEVVAIVVYSLTEQ